ncbi:HAMP domain-containing sensor histidine kinase [Aeromicrobium sp. IC_218]|uniref:sensor histidine kinase n=1 Tax=Aeromicrobium sp. IC_218 TaxID=2545468 RepID=UPI00103C9BC6|nr:HAMP domain-containing sensor histidine kinase [Aeromicrobium sp. IC_218]TCI99383.1 HAMP domain-containing histidine kinase [Aeromicrobium sp. IC_218]
MTNPVHRALSAATSRLSLATRILVLTAATVGFVLATINASVYFVLRDELVHSLDDALLQRAENAVENHTTEDIIRGYQPEALSLGGVQVGVIYGGTLFKSEALDDLAAMQYVSSVEREVALGRGEHSTRTARINGTHYRVVAVNAGSGKALVLAQSAESIYQSLRRMNIILWATSGVGILVAALAGWLVASTGLRPVRRLTSATERVARTQQLTPVEVHGHDELARLGTSFNAMLAALDASQQRQRQLVADAGHELRTPLTSLRTNIELMEQAFASDRPLSPEQRREVMDDVHGQLAELTTLVGDLVELARDEPLRRSPEAADFATVVEAAVDRVRRRAPGLTFDVRLQPWMFFGEPFILERAVINLLDNAAKWSPEGGTVTVRLVDGELTVVDEGPGIPPQDLPHVFERFYRSSEARTQPGSGLGLSIVAQAVARHGGSVTADSAPGRGALLTVRLPGWSPGPDAPIS